MCHNAASCTHHIRYVDTTAPLPRHAALPILQCGDSTSIASNGTATATDNCGGSPTITSSDSATVNCTGQAGVDRVWTATDSSHNAASCTQHISYVDTTAPLISCPADKQLQCG